MDRVKVVKILVSLLGGLLGMWLALGGLELRILGNYLGWHQQISLLAYPEHLFRIERFEIGGLTALGWPMVVLGSSWGGALFGFRIGESWSVPAMLLLSTLALAFPYMGTMLGLILLFLLLSTPEIRQAGSRRNDES